MNFRVPALQNLIRRHLLRHSAASTNPVPDAHFVGPPRLVEEDFYPRFRSSFVTTNFNIDESNSPLCLNASFRFYVMQSEAARKLGEDAGRESGALANYDAYDHPRGRRASYDSESDDSDEDADHRDSYDSDAPFDDFSDDDECFNESDDYTDDEDYEEKHRILT